MLYTALEDEEEEKEGEIISHWKLSMEQMEQETTARNSLYHKDFCWGRRRKGDVALTPPHEEGEESQQKSREGECARI